MFGCPSRCKERTRFSGIVRINARQSFWRDELVTNKDRWRDGFASNDFDGKGYQSFSVALREISDGTDKTRVRPPHFGARFGAGILSHYCAIGDASRLFEGAQRPNGAGIVNRADQNSVGLGTP